MMRLFTPILVSCLLSPRPAPAVETPVQVRRCLKLLRTASSYEPARILEIGRGARERSDLRPINRAAVIFHKREPRGHVLLIKPISSSTLTQLRHGDSLYVPARDLMLVEMTPEEHTSFGHEASALGQTRLTLVTLGKPSVTATHDQISSGTLLKLDGAIHLVLFTKSETLFTAGQTAKRSYAYVTVRLPAFPTPGVVARDQRLVRLRVDGTFEIDGHEVREASFVGEATAALSLIINGDVGPQPRVELTKVSLVPDGEERYVEGVTLADFEAITLSSR